MTMIVTVNGSVLTSSSQAGYTLGVSQKSSSVTTTDYMIEVTGSTITNLTAATFI